MTKRVRGPARTHHRPGARPPSERSAARRQPALGAAASQLEGTREIAQFVVEERPTLPAAPETAQAAPAAHQRHRIKAGSLLATRAATEYVYVAKDMRRILVVAGALAAVMLVLWLLLVVMHVVPLPFY